MKFKELIIDTKKSADFEYVEGNLHLIEMNGISLDHAVLNYSKPHKKEVHKKDKHIELFFMLQGTQKYYDDKQTISSTTTGEYGFFHLPEINGNIDFVPYEQTYNSLGIEFSVPYLEALFKNDLELLGDFGKSIYANEASFFAKNTSIPQKAKWIIREILNNPYKNKMKQIYLEIKINELLLLIIDTNEKDFCKNVSSEILNKNDIEKLYYIREIITQNIDNPFSLKQLSRISGLNEFKLKKGFKEIFDSTVFEYIFEEKMQLGKKLIIETNQSIAEIASNVGYKNATHFTAAFKKHYQTLPSFLRK